MRGRGTNVLSSRNCLSFLKLILKFAFQDYEDILFRLLKYHSIYCTLEIIAAVSYAKFSHEICIISGEKSGLDPHLDNTVGLAYRTIQTNYEKEQRYEIFIKYIKI